MNNTRRRTLAISATLLAVTLVIGGMLAAASGVAFAYTKAKGAGGNATDRCPQCDNQQPRPRSN